MTNLSAALAFIIISATVGLLPNVGKSAENRALVPIEGVTFNNAKKSISLSLKLTKQSRIISPLDGVIVYANDFRDYGPLLILSHACAFDTVLAFTGHVSFIRRTGKVKGGETIGMLASGGDVYLEIRSNGKPVYIESFIGEVVPDPNSPEKCLERRSANTDPLQAYVEQRKPDDLREKATSARIQPSAPNCRLPMGDNITPPVDSVITKSDEAVSDDSIILPKRPPIPTPRPSPLVAALVRPVPGCVVSLYREGVGSSPDGVEFDAPEGTPVLAADGGVVIYAGDGLRDLANTILIRHENGLVTVYGYVGNMLVNRRDRVVAGQKIAVSGRRDELQRPRLHFQVRKDAAPVDPSDYLKY